MHVAGIAAGNAGEIMGVPDAQIIVAKAERDRGGSALSALDDMVALRPIK